MPELTPLYPAVTGSDLYILPVVSTTVLLGVVSHLVNTWLGKASHRSGRHVALSLIRPTNIKATVCINPSLILHVSYLYDIGAAWHTAGRGSDLCVRGAGSLSPHPGLRSALLPAAGHPRPAGLCHRNAGR